MPTVNLPDGRRINFPDGTPPDEMTAAIDALPPVRGPLEAVHNIVSGATHAAQQGAAFGFMDELNASARAGMRGIGNLFQGQAPEFGANYDRALADERAREQQFSEEHPIISGTAGVVGGVATAIPGVGAVKTAASIPRVIGTAAATGAGYGAVGGFGAGQGGFENRMASAGQGAMLGGLLGGALPVVGAGANQAAGFISNISGLRNPRNVALDQLGRALRRDDTTAVQARDTVAATDPGKPMALVDAGGDSVLRLGRAVETIPGAGSNRAKKFLNERQADQVDRVGGDIGKHLSGDDFYKTLDDLDKTRRVEAAPLYDEAYRQPFVMNATLEMLLDRPSTKQALSRAYRIAAEEGRDPRGLGLDLDADGNTVINKTAASMQTLDYVKRGLDDVLEQFRDTTTGKLHLDEGGKAINQTRVDYIKTIDAMNPTYAEARKAWGGPTQTMEAARLGRRYANGDAEVTHKRFQELSEGDKTAFRLGVAREMIGKVENTRDTHNAVPRIFGSKGQRSRLRALFPDQPSFDAFEKAMNDEIRMANTRQVVTGNSVTSRIAAEQEDAGALANAAMDYAGGGVRSVLFGLANRAKAKARGINEASAEELSKMLFDADRNVQVRALAEVRRRQRHIAKAAERGVRKVGAGTAGTANLAGQGLASDE